MFLKDKDLKNTVVIKQESFEFKELLTKKKEQNVGIGFFAGRFR